MALENHIIQEIIDLKQQDESNRLSSKFKGKLLSNRDIAEQVLGTRGAESTVRRVWKKYHKQGHYKGVTGSNPIAGGSVSNPIAKRKQAVGKRFVITSAQNNTHIHEELFQSILRYCEHNDAELMISCFYYNKNGFQNGKRQEAWFDERIKPYLVNESVQLAKGLVFNGELNILPTSRNPLSGFDTYNGEQSGIIPHVKMELQPLPSPKYNEARALYTTGALTKRNYIQQKAGQLAEWDHIFGAVVVEIAEDGTWFVRQLHAESSTGEFYDLTEKYTPKGVETGFTVEAINYGDVHVAKLDQDVAEVSWKNVGASMLDVLKPKYQLVHDVFDAQARNHHNYKDGHFLFKMFNEQTEDIRVEVRDTTEVLTDMKRDFSEVIVVESNHDLALLKYLKEQDYRKDPINAIFFLEMQLETYKAIEARDNWYSCFETACHKVNENTKEGIRFLRGDESFRLCGHIEAGQHGMNGVNGSRGSVQSYIKQGLKFNTGHTHAASIKRGVYTAGVSGKLDMGYNVGGSSWVQAHIVTYPNGKRTIVNIKNGKWRA